MIKREKNTTYIATISGGKDSVTMCDLLLKNAYPVDYIVFNDTLDEFKDMYDYIDRVESYFKLRYKKEITRLKPKKSYNQYIFHVRKRGERKGKCAGLPNASNPFCEWRRDAKIVPFERWSKKLGEHKIYIGITTDEQNRTNRDDCKFIYPLIDIFKMSEADCKQYLIEQEMENPLYRHFNRTGCRKCQYQSDRDFFNIWKYYPEVWNEFKYYENEINKLNNVDEKNKYWFTNYRTCADMENKFIEADKQGSLFDFSDEPLKDCFCKI
jgi:3'-phosphoadenosine 5'-phosphosulfate sulfotransferase (PAPS reductase)/FAD synthetase